MQDPAGTLDVTQFEIDRALQKLPYVVVFCRNEEDESIVAKQHRKHFKLTRKQDLFLFVT